MVHPRQSLGWHLLIFYICIDQLSIILILFLHEDNSISSLYPKPRIQLLEQRGAQRRGHGPNAPPSCSVCCCWQGLMKLWFFRSPWAVGIHPLPPPTLPLLRWRAWVRGGGGVGSPPVQTGKACVHTWAIPTHQEWGKWGCLYASKRGHGTCSSSQ